MRVILLMLFLTLPRVQSWGQVATAPQGAPWQGLFFNSSERVLPLLIQAAVNYSAEMEVAEAEKQMAIENVKITQKQIYTGLSVNAGYFYGNMNNFFGQGSADPINNFRVPNAGRYNLGLNLGIPIGDMISRHHQIRRQEWALKQTESGQKIREREIRQQVINMYQEVVLARRLMEISQESMQNASINNQLAEKKFMKREIRVEEMLSIKEMHTRAAVALENAKTTYETSFLMLEELIGMKVSDLLTGK
jgi:outer membrane protein TolC